MINQDKILIIVPHPDDEALLTAGVIKQAVLSNKQISVAVVTNGDYLCVNHTKGEARLKESLQALTALGVEKKDIYFLGYPDTGFEPEVSFLSRLKNASDNELVASSASEQTYALSEHPDYCFARTGAHAPYTKAAFEKDLSALLAQTEPQLVITTAQSDIHGDHSALFDFVRAAIQQCAEPRAKLWVGMVHSPDGDLSWPRLTEKTSAFEKPQENWGEQLKWDNRISVPLPEKLMAQYTLQSPKCELIKQYKTAVSPDEPQVYDYLLSFAKNEEIFWNIDL